jgi:hypothetical protein
VKRLIFQLLAKLLNVSAAALWLSTFTQWMVDKSLREKEECGRVPARRAAQNVTAGDDGGGEIVRFFARLDLALRLQH